MRLITAVKKVGCLVTLLSIISVDGAFELH